MAMDMPRLPLRSEAPRASEEMAEILVSELQATQRIVVPCVTRYCYSFGSHKKHVSVDPFNQTRLVPRLSTIAKIW